jgi:hypothetical protein
MPGLLLTHVLAHLSLGGDCRRIAVRSAIAGGRSARVTTPLALDTISGTDFTFGASIALAVSIRYQHSLSPAVVLRWILNGLPATPLIPWASMKSSRNDRMRLEVVMGTPFAVVAFGSSVPPRLKVAI